MSNLCDNKNMPKRSSKKDINELAASIVEEATSKGRPQKENNPNAAALGRLGGLKG